MKISSVIQPFEHEAQIETANLKPAIGDSELYAYRTLMKGLLGVLLVIFTFATSVSAQEKSGIVYPNRFGLSYQKKLGVDIGLISFNQWNDRSTMTFYDISLGVESFIVKPFILSPKLSLDFGIGDVISFGGGIDISLPTDFSNAVWMLTPKVGMSMASLIRVYYGRHIFQQDHDFPDLGKHRLSIEVNLAAFHDFKIGL